MFQRKPKNHKSWFSSFTAPIISKIDEVKEYFELNGLITENQFKKLLWCFVLVIIYISFQHNLEHLIVRKEKAEIQMKETHASFIEIKASYMYDSKYTEISKKLQKQGVIKNMEPPVKIIVKD